MILSNLNKKGIDRINLVYLTSSKHDVYTRVKKLRINSDYSTNKLKPTRLELPKYKEITTGFYTTGDLVTVDGDEFYISAVLYERQRNGKYRTVLLGSKDGKTEILINPRLITSVKRIESDHKLKGSAEISKNIELPEGNLKIKEIIASNINWGDTFTYVIGDNENQGIFKSFSQGFITTIDNLLIPVSALKSVTNFKIQSIYPKLDFDTKNNRVVIDANREAANLAKKAAQYVYGRPEFKFGYYIDNRGDGKALVFPRYKTLINGKLYDFLPFNVSPDLKCRGLVTDESLLEVNDTVLVAEMSEDLKQAVLTKYVILDVSENSYVVLKSKQNYKSADGVEHKIVAVDKNALKNGKLFKQESNNLITFALYDPEIVNTTDAAQELLKHFSKKFGARVEFIEDVNVPFARIKDGVVQINMARKPDGQSSELYIMELGIHEFTHLAITALKMEHPEIYLTLVNSITELEKANIRNSDFYNAETLEELEEVLVRKVTEMILENGNDLTVDGVDNVMKTAFSSLLLIAEKNIPNLQESLTSTLDKSYIFLKNTQITQEEMLARTLKDEIMKRINYVC